MFTNEELQKLLRREMLSGAYPYEAEDEQAVIAYLNRIEAELKREKIRVHAESLHFGSGYASYIQWCCYTDSDVTVEQGKYGWRDNIEGIAVAISTLAPVVLMGRMTKSITYNEKGNETGGSYTLFSRVENLTIEEKYLPLVKKLERIFMKYSYTILRKEDVAKPLPFDADIPTILRDKRDYLVWDAIFYWED